MNGSPDKKKIDERRKYIFAFNDTMVRIWRERITMLGVIDTGRLYRSVLGLKATANADASEFSLSQEFVTYGIFQNYGTGREVPRGNSGDIGRAKVRRPRRWFDKKYYSSVMNLRDYFAESFAQQYIAMVSNALSDRSIRRLASS